MHIQAIIPVLMGPGQKPQIAVFARYPVVGEVKTRLVPSLPAGFAAVLHLAMVMDTAESALAAQALDSWPVALYWTDPEGRGAKVDLPDHVIVRQQRTGDLGARLAAAFSELLSHPADRAVVVGSDCPDLGPDTIQAALAALDGHDLVIGPARDGGYYLIGLRSPAPALFEGISWGTDRVLTQTLERAARLGLTIHLLEVLEDVDTPDDLVRLIARRAVSEPRSGLRTEQALRMMGLLPARG